MHIRDLAIKLHGNQLYGSKPYVYHLDKVVAVLNRFGHTDVDLINAAYLHDVLEDTNTTKDDLRQYVSEKSLLIINNLTDEPGKNRKERKLLTYKKIKTDRNSIIVKLADRIANVEENGKLEMYQQEHAVFKSELYNKKHNLESMWNYLDSLLQKPNLNV